MLINPYCLPGEQLILYKKMKEKIYGEKAIRMYEKLFLLRKYEEKIYFLFLEGIMPGTIHQAQGQEATAVGMLKLQLGMMNS